MSIPHNNTKFSVTMKMKNIIILYIIYTCIIIIYSLVIQCFTTFTQWGQTAVYCASAYGHCEVVKLLIQAGTDLELQHKVHTLWKRFMLAHAVCDIAV